MEPVILEVVEAVDIAAPPAAVFALVAEPLAKARLNPAIQVIRIEREDPGPLREGSVTFFRLQKGRRIFEYRTRCRRLEPGRLLETQAELPTLVRARVEVAPASGGTRLRQREECEVTAEMVEGLAVPRRAERAWRTLKLLHLFLPDLARETYGLVLRERADALRLVMKRELQAWLHGIKTHLETEHGTSFGSSNVRTFGCSTNRG